MKRDGSVKGFDDLNGPLQELKGGKPFTILITRICSWKTLKAFDTKFNTRDRTNTINYCLFNDFI